MFFEHEYSVLYIYILTAQTTIILMSELRLITLTQTLILTPLKYMNSMLTSALDYGPQK